MYEDLMLSAVLPFRLYSGLFVALHPGNLWTLPEIASYQKCKQCSMENI